MSERPPPGLSKMQHRHLLQRLSGLRIPRRLDIALLVLVAATVGTCATVLYASVDAGARAGWFDRPIIYPLPDDRKLTNIRSGAPLLAATFHAPDRAVFLSQAGRRIHSLEPATGIWREERVDNISVLGDLVQLRSSCGTHDASRRMACDDNEAVWALSEHGALLRRKRAHEWQTLIGDTSLRGANGKLVQEDELSTAALSDDGQWLLIGTHANGFGLFRQVGRYWQPIPASDQAAPSARDILHGLWWRGSFWLGTSQGLIQVTPPPGLRVQQRAELTGAIVAMAGDRKRPLLVLATVPCTQALPCQTLSAFTDPSQPPVTLFAEARFPELSQGGLFFATWQGDQVVVAGRAGVYGYAPDTRVWRQIDARAVTTVTPVGNTFLYGFNGGVGRVASGALQSQWTVASEDIRKIVTNGPQGPLALTVTGDIYRLDADRKSQLVFERSAMPVEPSSLVDGAMVDDLVFLQSDKGAVIHSSRTRQNTSVSGLESWMSLPSTVLVTSNDLMYAVDQRSTEVQALAFDLEQLAAGKVDPQVTPVVQGAVRAIQPWGDGIAMIDAAGSAVKIAPNREVRLTGQAATGLQGIAFNDVVQSPAGLYAATDKGVFAYDLNQRSWSKPLGPQTRGPVATLGLNGAAVWGVTVDGDLVDIDGASTLIGGNEPSGIQDEQLSDVLAAGDRLYLAGNGRVGSYSLSARRVTDSYRLRGGPVALLGQLQSKPVAVAGDTLWFGNAALSDTEGEVIGAWVAPSHVWTLREQLGERFLMGHAAGNPADRPSRLCFFRQPKAHAGPGRIIDAVEVRPGLIAVLSSAGLFFYSESQRRWHTHVKVPVADTDRVLMIGTRLVWISMQPGSSTLRSVGADSIELPHSCSSTQLRIDFASFRTRSLSIGADGKRVAWIDAGGAARELQANGVGSVLASQSGAPGAGELRRIFSGDDALLVTDANGFWVYRPVDRSWHRIALKRGDTDMRTVSDILLERSGAAWRVTVHADAGTFTGVWTFGDDHVAVSAVDDRQLRLGAAGNDLLDVTKTQADLWTFVFAERIVFLDPATKVVRQLSFAAGDRTRRMVATPGGSFAIVARGGKRVSLLRPGTDPWIEGNYQQVDLGVAETAFLAGASDLIRFAADGTVLRCTFDSSGYPCIPIRSLQSRVAPAGTGSAIVPEPVVRLSKGSRGALFAEYSGGKTHRVADAAVALDELAPPLKASWLEWDRGKAEFNLRLRGKVVRLTPNQLIRNEILSMTLPGPVIDIGPQAILKANQSGIWVFADRTLSLVTGPSDFHQAELSGALTAAHGVVSGDGVTLGFDGTRRTPITHQVALGAFNIFEDVRNQGLTYTRKDGTAMSRTGAGFPWDRSRSVAYVGRSIVTSTPAGIVSADLSRVLDHPPGAADGDLWVMQHDNLMVRSGTRWLIRDSDTWAERTGPPTFGRTLIDNDRWRWSATQAGVTVELHQEPHRFALHQGTSGVYFASDMLLHASGTAKTFLLLSEAWLEVGRDLTELQKQLGRTLPAPLLDSLHSLHPTPAVNDVYARRGQSVLRWNAVKESFAAVAGPHDPFQRRLLLDEHGLKFEFRNGSVLKQVVVAKPDGRQDWAAFNFVHGRFPFDFVNSIAEHDGLMLIGSAAGLEVHRTGQGIGIGKSVALLDLDRSQSARLTPVRRMGKPVGKPGITQIESAAGCVEFDGSAYRDCSGAPATRFERGKVPGLWRWESGSSGLVGHYMTDKGEDARQIVLGAGRFEHDVLEDMVTCGAQSATLWRSRQWVSTHSDSELSLARILNTHDLTGEKPTDLFCVPRDTSAGAVQIRAGMYLSTAKRHYRLESHGAWQPVDDARARSELLMHESNELVFDSKRLRIRRSGRRALTFEYRPLQGDWLPLRWSQRTLDIDTLHGLENVNGQLWGLSDAGFVTLGDVTPKRLGFLPTDFHLVRYPGEKRCEVTDFRIGKTLQQMRCNGDKARVYDGNLAVNSDSGNWQPASQDPFVEMQLLTPDKVNPLSVRRVDRVNSRPGVLQFKLLESESRLADGRFRFDDLATFVYGDSKLELVTADGWFQLPASAASFRLGDFRRPTDSGGLDPRDVTDLAWTLHEDERRFCMATADKAVATVESKRIPVPRCDRHFGKDSVWQYVGTSDGLSMHGRDLRGRRSARRFRDGRFGDQVVTGMPVASVFGGNNEAYLVPTLAGVVSLSPSGDVHGLYMPPFRGLPNTDAAPVLLYVDDKRVIRYAAPDGLYPLLDSQAGTWAFDIGKILDRQQLAIQDSPAGGISIEWHEAGRLHWKLFDRVEQTASRSDRVLIPIHDWSVFRKNRQRWGDPAPFIDFSLRKDSVSVTVPGRRPSSIDMKAHDTLDFVLQGERMLLIESDELWSVELGQMTERAFAQKPQSQRER